MKAAAQGREILYHTISNAIGSLRRAARHMLLRSFLLFLAFAAGPALPVLASDQPFDEWLVELRA
ncbi:MAG: hypothetical protein VW619_05350, partial [Rhodobiaceae bacterium]